jgi:YegS/Rv2252/BmrU family lipid kinase
VDQALPRSAALVINTKSRKGQAAFRDACRLLKEAGIHLIAAHAVPRPERMADVVREVIEAGAPMVIVGGGDGSLSSSVDHFVGTDTVFAVLPLGTANSFARTIQVPLDIAGAVGVIANGKAHRIDLGMIDGDYFANCAAIGISPLIAETVPHGLKKWLGRPGYLAWAAVQMLRFRPFHLTLEEEDGTTHRMDALELRIANGRYHGGTELVDTQVDDGDIVIQAIEGRMTTKLLWSWGLSLLGPDRARGTVREFRGDRFRVITDPPLPISIDGEVLAETPVNAHLAHKVILAAVPR